MCFIFTSAYIDCHISSWLPNNLLCPMDRKRITELFSSIRKCKMKRELLLKRGNANLVLSDYQITLLRVHWIGMS